MAKLTPMQQQYQSIKTEHPNDIVLFRLGDFYESFHDDAKTLSKVLGITLTGRGKGESRIPMAGIPYHALDNYLPKLVSTGYKVAIVEQLTEPKPGQLVERDVTKVITAGTLTDEKTLSDDKNNFIVSLSSTTNKNPLYGFSFCDISTGELRTFETSSEAIIKGEIVRLQPAELVVPDSLGIDLDSNNVQLTKRSDLDYDLDHSYELLLNQFETKTLEGFGIEGMHSSISSLGALLSYLQECQRSVLAHIKKVSLYNFTDFMPLDQITIRNLELIYPISGTDLSSTVFQQLNNCQTSMGKRKLRSWVLHPYIVEQPIKERLDSVEELCSDQIKNSKLREKLLNVPDIERIIGRIGLGSANARDLLALESGLRNVAELMDLLDDKTTTSRLKHIQYSITNTDAIDSVTRVISEAIHPEPPNTISEGNLIKEGYNPQVDELRSLCGGSKSTLASIQSREIEKTGIPNLKISYNKVFGYYIEITKSHIAKVPEDYIRKQTLTNSERYITEELKVLESRILNAEEQLLKLEKELFEKIRSDISKYSQELLFLSNLTAELDALTNFAYIAKQYRFTKPEIIKGRELHIKDGRHFVVERLQDNFVPNDTDFESDDKVIVLTGPNMSGKSTYIRQTALLILLAQIGCFVPAKEMRFSIIDRIFTRVGASDNLSRGQSTFMVEMSESANILNNATESSLIILDEVGRGTSTYDGVAIAWAMVEYIHEEIAAKTLFATHYHELIELENSLEGVKNYHVNVLEKGDNVEFQHKIKKGSTSKSYGVHVAEMAGVPKKLLLRANEILNKFESNGKTNPKKGSPKKPKSIAPQQLDLL